MRDEGVIYVAGHPLLNRRCTILPGCIRLRNDLCCVGWGVKLYSLTRQQVSRKCYIAVSRSIAQPADDNCDDNADSTHCQRTSHVL